MGDGMGLIAELTARFGAGHVLTGADTARFVGDWTGKYTAAPLAVVRPGSTAEVAETLRLAARHGVPVVPVGGGTGLVGGSMTTGGLMISLERMNRIRELRPEARLAVVEAGVVLSRLHDAADAAGLNFPLWFGARGSAIRRGGANMTCSKRRAGTAAHAPRSRGTQEPPLVAARRRAARRRSGYDGHVQGPLRSGRVQRS